MNRVCAVAAIAVLLAVLSVTGRAGEGVEHHWEIRKRERQDKIGGVPESILKLQSSEKVTPPSIEEAIAIALEAADEAARPLIDTAFHKGRRIVVPDEYETIQAAIDAAESGDVITVKPGIYYELLVMKNGVKLVSDISQGGEKLVPVEGARMKLPRRTLRTIVDGSKSPKSRHGMVDFDPGVGPKTIVDGFTFQNLPMQDHHIPGHAHGLNVRGASPVIMNCCIRNNGSTGIGNHVVYTDQEREIPERDFRCANIRHWAAGVIYRNVVSGNFGLGIGCNHFSAPNILGNEVFLNSDVELGGDPSPGMGAKHGAAPTIIGNVIHDNLGGGILSKVGAPQGAYQIDRPTHPTVIRNVVFRNGKVRPGISSDGGGSKETPVHFMGNFVYEAGAVGIALSNSAVGILEDNIVSGSETAGIVINGATALKLNRNQVTGANAPGFVIVNGATVIEMIGNAADSNEGPRFKMIGGTIADPNG